MPLSEPGGGPAVAEVLASAVAALGGQQRSGQVQMATEVAAAMADERHLLVQAGTGTGKSLGYLVPALLCDKRVVVATATLALQHQLVERDIPRLMAALADQPGIDTSYAVLKGRSNYACLHRIREGVRRLAAVMEQELEIGRTFGTSSALHHSSGAATPGPDLA